MHKQIARDLIENLIPEVLFFNLINHIRHYFLLIWNTVRGTRELM